MEAQTEHCRIKTIKFRGASRIKRNAKEERWQNTYNMPKSKKRKDKQDGGENIKGKKGKTTREYHRDKKTEGRQRITEKRTR